MHLMEAPALVLYFTLCCATEPNQISGSQLYNVLPSSWDVSQRAECAQHIYARPIKKIRRALCLWFFFFLMVGVWQQIKVCILKHASHQAEVRGGIYCVFIPAASHPHSYSCVPVKKKKSAGGREVLGSRVEPAARRHESACVALRLRQRAFVSVTAALCHFLRTMWARRPSTRLLVQAVWNASVLSWFREQKLSKSCDQTSFHLFSSQLSNISDAPLQGVTTKLKAD